MLQVRPRLQLPPLMATHKLRFDAAGHTLAALAPAAQQALHVQCFRSHPGCSRSASITSSVFNAAGPTPVAAAPVVPQPPAVPPPAHAHSSAAGGYGASGYGGTAAGVAAHAQPPSVAARAYGTQHSNFVFCQTDSAESPVWLTCLMC